MIKIFGNKESKADDIAIIGQDKITEKMLRKLHEENILADVGTVSRNSESDEILQYTDRAKVFGLHFLEIIRLFEKRCSIPELMKKIKDESKEDKEKRTEYTLKKVVLLFSNKKGDIRRTIIVEKENVPVGEQ